MADLANLRIVFSGSIEKLQKSLEDITGSLFKLQSRTAKIGTALSQGLTVPLAGIAGAAVKMSNDFNRSMANVATLLPENSKRVNQLKDDVQSMAVATGKSTQELASGLYEVLSAQSDTADTTKKLEINTKAAIAGLATIPETVRFTTAVTKGYGDVTAEATQKVADLGAKAVEVGNTTFPELAQSIGQVVPIAVQLGVSQEELFAVMGTFTGVTGDASLVTTQLRSALNGLLDPSKELQSLYKAIGVESGQALIQQYGLAGALQMVTRSAEMSNIPLPKMLGRIEAVTLALSISGKQADSYSKTLDMMGGASGTVDRQFRAQTEGINKLGFQFDQLKQRAVIIAQTFGDALSPGISHLADMAGQLMTKVEQLVKWFSQLSPATRTTVVEIGAVALAIGPVLFLTSKLVAVYANLWPLLKLIGSGFGLLTTAVGYLLPAMVSVTTATAGFILQLGRLVFTAAITGFSALSSLISATVVPALLFVGRTVVGLVAATGPLGLLALAVAGIVTVWYKWDEISTICQNTYNAIKTWMLDKLSAIWDGIKNKTAEVTGFFKGMYTAVVGASYVPDMVTEIGVEFQKLYAKMVQPTITATTEVSAKMLEMQKSVAIYIAQMIENAVAQFSNFKTALMNAFASGGVGGAIDVVGQKLTALGTTAGTYLSNAFGKMAEAAKKPVNPIKITGNESEKAAAKLQKLRDKVAELGDKIDDLAKLNNPTAALVTRIRDLLASGKTGNELAAALKKIRDEYSGSEKDLKKFEKALEAANDQVTDQAKRIQDLNRRVEDLAGVDKFPELTRQIEACFGQRSQMTAEEFARKLAAIGDAFATTDEKAQAFEKTVQDIADKQGKGFWESMIPAGFKKMDPKALADFTQQLGQSVEGSVANALSNALRSGDVKAAMRELGGSIGETLGTAVFGPIGGAIGGFIGDKIMKDISQIGESTNKTIRGIATAIDTIFPGIGTGLGMLTTALIGGSQDKDTQVRAGFIKWIDDVIAKVGQIQIMNQNGGFMNLSSSMFSADGDRFSKPGWASDWWQEMGDSAATAFSGIGVGLAQVLGLTTEMGSQVAVMLSDAFGGSVDNLRLFLNAANIDTKSLEDALISAGNSGKLSWQEVEVALQGVTAATGDGLVAVGNVDGAINQLIASGGRGAVAIQSLQNIGIEAMEAGAKTLDDLKAKMRASGKYTEEQITQIFQALANRGITSLDQLAAVSDRTGGGIIADLTTMGFQFDDVAQNIESTTENLQDLDKAANNLDGKNIDIHVNVDYQTSGSIPPGLESANGSVFARGSRLQRKFASGGIVRSPTNFLYGNGNLGLMGEKGPEAIMPLTDIGGKLGVYAQMAPSVSRAESPVIVNFNIDASNSGPGVHAQVEQALEQWEGRIVGKTIETIVDRKRRGGRIGNALSR